MDKDEVFILLARHKDTAVTIDKKLKVSPTTVMKYLGRPGVGLVPNCANNGTTSPLFH